MPKSANKKFQNLFEYSPVAILEVDYSPLLHLGKQLKEQTVTNIRQYLLEHTPLVKKTFNAIRIVEANSETLKLFNVKSKKDLILQWQKTFTTSAIDLLVEQFVSILEGGDEFRGEFKCMLKKRQYRDIFLNLLIQERKTIGLSSVLVTLLDISPWKRIERQLRKKAQLDGLTNLLNHLTIIQRLDEELIRAKRYGLSLSCLMIDLDHFKIINDKFGHPRGDKVLNQVAQMIKNCVRKSDVVGRYGGDEFLVILPETPVRNAGFAASRIQKMFAAKIFRYQKLITFHIHLSIGIAGYPSKKIKNAQDFISLVDKAMYEAKKAGRNRFAVA